MRALRTTLILGGFWLIVILTGGYLIEFRLKDQEADLKAREAMVKQELTTDEELVNNIPTVQMDLQNATQIWLYRAKAVPKREASHETYGYLDEILSRKPSTLNFDFIKAEVGDTAGIHSANYKLSGEARFTDLYAFIWYLEHLPRYIRINSLNLQEARERSGGGPANRWVGFEMSITALSTDRLNLDDIPQAEEPTAPTVIYDPFIRPYARTASTAGPVVPANTRNLPNVYECTIKALTPTQVYIKDKKGDLRVLNLGDEVYLGHLANVLPEEKRAVFELDQLTPPRQVSLVMKAEK